MHAPELGETVDHEAEKLNDAEAEAEGRRGPGEVKAIELADQISAALGRFHSASASGEVCVDQRNSHRPFAHG